MFTSHGKIKLLRWRLLVVIYPIMIKFLHYYNNMRKYMNKNI